MDANVIDRIKRFLYENGYSAGKVDIDWILDQMSEELEYQAEENGGVVQRQLICEVITRGKEVKIISELPGVSKERIKMNVCNKELEIDAESEKKRYYEIIHLPLEANTKRLRSTIINGMLEVTFEKTNAK
ncbi:MAG: Hsp20/alpha crystallin family protein [Nitrososphaeraceae archaeon]